jgi:hypothetical protein
VIVVGSGQDALSLLGADGRERDDRRHGEQEALHDDLGSVVQSGRWMRGPQVKMPAASAPGKRPRMLGLPGRGLYIVGME